MKFTPGKLSKNILLVRAILYQTAFADLGIYGSSGIPLFWIIWPGWNMVSLIFLLEADYRC